MKLILGTCVALFIQGSLAANILAFLPFPAFSHFNAFEEIFKGLARKGHNVTVVSPFPQKTPIANYHDIVVPNILKMQQKGNPGTNFKDYSGFWFATWGMSTLCLDLLKKIMTMDEITNFIYNDTSKFDLLLLEPLVCQEPFTALSHKYSAPYIALSPNVLTGSFAESVGNPNPYSYVPFMLSPVSDRMTFWERGLNSLYYIGNSLVYNFYSKTKLENLLREHIKYPGSENLPSLDSLLNNVSLVLVDSHFSISSPRPYLPNIIEFGGLSIKEGKKLPEDLKKFLDEAKDGAILLSFGSNFNSSALPKSTVEKMVSVFSKLKQRIVMKWEDGALARGASNIYTSQWLPQSSILGHPNMKVFISHCGIHGVSEAMYHGVPILATPIFADQQQNMKYAVQAEYALYLNLNEFTESELQASLMELINNPKYRRNALLRSKIMKDRPLKPLDTAIYWIEYVIKYSGAYHLRSAAVNLSWYQYFLLDIIGAVTLVLGLIVASFVFLLRAMCRGKTERKRDSRKKKQ